MDNLRRTPMDDRPRRALSSGFGGGSRLQQEGREPRGGHSAYFMWCNFGRVHQTLRVTPAMDAGVTNHVWSVEEIVGLLG